MNRADVPATEPTAPADPPPGSPWLAHYEPGVPPALSAASDDFTALVAGAAAVAPTFPAVTDGRRSMHYAVLSAAADAVAAALRRDGIGPGDAVVVALPPGPTVLSVVLGALRAGACVAPVDGADASAAAEVAATLRAPFAIVEDRIAVAYATACDQAGIASRRLVCVDMTRELPLPLRVLARFAGRPSDLPLADDGIAARTCLPWRRWLAGDGAAPDDPAIGGTLWCDGVPYGQAALTAGASMLSAWLTDASPGDDTWLVLAPLSTPLGVVAALGAAPLLRARVALPGGWVPSDVGDALRYLRPAWVVSDVGAVARLVGSPDLGHSELRSVRGWLVDGPVPAPLARAFTDATSLDLCVGWAPRGAAGFVTCNPVNGVRGPHSVGLPLPGVTIRAVDAGLEVEAPNVVPPGTIAQAGARIDADGFVDVDHAPDARSVAQRVGGDDSA